MHIVLKLFSNLNLKTKVIIILVFLVTTISFIFLFKYYYDKTITLSNQISQLNKQIEEKDNTINTKEKEKQSLISQAKEDDKMKNPIIQKVKETIYVTRTEKTECDDISIGEQYVDGLHKILSNSE